MQAEYASKAWRLVAFALAAGLSACGGEPPDATPEGAVRELTVALSSYRGDPADAEIIYGFLSREAKDNLAERASRYSAATGDTRAAHEMIVPSQFTPAFELRELTSQRVGTKALVTARGLRPEEVAEIPCVFEEGGWRVNVELPPLPPERIRELPSEDEE